MLSEAWIEINSKKKNKNVAIMESIQENNPSWVQNNKLTISNYDDDHSLNNDITLDELNRALRSIKKDSSPGLDAIDYPMSIRLPQRYHKLITNIFNIFFKFTISPVE